MSWALALGLLTLAAAVHAIPTFHRIDTDALSASPSGRYLALLERSDHQAFSVWVYTVPTGRWRRFMTGLHGVAHLRWSSDERDLLLGVCASASHITTIWRLPVHGTPQRLTRISRGVDWLPLPDGRGIVATARDPRTRMHQGEMEVRARVKIYSFATHRWHMIARTPWDEEADVGEDLAVRRHSRNWVISFHQFGPVDCSSYWVNLATRRGMQAEDGDPRFLYSPDGRYVITDGNLYLARSWPRASRRGLGIVHGKLLLADIGYGIWAPDSRHLVDFQYEKASYRILTLATLTHSTPMPQKDVAVFQWFGPKNLLLLYHRPGSTLEYASLTDLTGKVQRKIFIAQW